MWGSVAASKQGSEDQNRVCEGKLGRRAVQVSSQHRAARDDRRFGHGVVIMAGGHNTVSGVTLKAHWRTGGETGETGHYGFGVRGHAQDNLVQDSTPDKFPQINVIGVDKRPTQKTATDAWIERWPGETTVPLNLYEAQRAHRLDKTATTPREGEKKP